MPINFIKFFTPSYLFDLRPTIDRETAIFLLVFFGILIIGGIIARIMQGTKKHDQYIAKLFSKYVSLLVTMGLIGVVLVWFRYETAAIFSARFWLVLWVILFAIWLVKIVKYQYTVIPQAKEKSEQRKIFNKYLPKKK